MEQRAQQLTAGGFTPTVRGFTLVELLVVMAIVGIMLSLVGPFTVKQLDNLKRAEEREQLQQTLAQLRFQAFQQRQSMLIETNGKLLTATPRASQWRGRVSYDKDQPSFSYSYQWTEFPRQQLLINAHGFVANEDNELLVRQGEREFVLRVPQLREEAANAPR